MSRNENEKRENESGRARRRWLLPGAILLCIAAVAVYLVARRPESATGRMAARPVPTVAATTDSSPAVAASPGGKADLTISPEMADRAGLRYAFVETRSLAEQLRTTGSIQPNAYRETRVTPLVGGRLTRVNVQLGDFVRQGQILAMIFSSDLAEAQMKFLTVDANLQFHISQDKRFERLVEIGAVSRQEQEEVRARLREHHAEHAALRERMKLYGLTEAEIDRLQTASDVRSEVPVHSPSSGVITTRNANPGQVAMTTDALFSVTDLSSVWVIASFYEKDFATLRTGAGVTITTPAAPSRGFRGTIAYIDPRVDPQTRTAQVRIETLNPNQSLKLGMFVDVALDLGGARLVPAVPKSAVQAMGEERIVFVKIAPGSFQIRRVEIGGEIGEWAEALRGLTAGEEVVTEGSFFLRAEMGRSLK
ncbi:MAG: efflux RND transporter periplasmic adaptor subunit [Blastocatellia bacterium]|nr:efflux RND transporter periplasmic adaptor subunit [Blastocatellia bacterium]